MIATRRHLVIGLLLAGLCCASAFAADSVNKAPADRPSRASGVGEKVKSKRLLLLGQSPDGHPWRTHEYLAGLRILSQCLEPVDGLQVRIVNADEPWKQGPALIDQADGVVVFLSQGAKWAHQDPARLEALQRLARRGGGLVALHWGMGGKDAQYIEEFVKLFGACHGGPDRKYKVVTVTTEIAASRHPIMQGVGPIEVHDEFYYQLKLAQPAEGLAPLLKVPIEGRLYPVALAWDRPDGGRSFAFSGLHFHENWRLEPYRRMVTQAVLWTIKTPVPAAGLPLHFSEHDLTLPRPKPETP